jgi:hypothetical protein
MEKLPYYHRYKLSLSIGYPQAMRKGEVNPSEYGEYSEEEWDALSREEQEDWLYRAAAQWADDYIEIVWTE